VGQAGDGQQRDDGAVVRQGVHAAGGHRRDPVYAINQPKDEPSFYRFFQNHANQSLLLSRFTDYHPKQ
jgi:hypothetical protein